MDCECQEPDKLDRLCELYGEDIDTMAGRVIFDSVAAGICMNDDCDFTADYEPDCDAGWCEECETQTVVSVMVLIGMH